MTAAKRLTLVLGMESYNTTLFDSLQHRFSTACPAVHLSIFYDTDCLERPDVLADAIKQSDAVFTALMVIDDSAEVLVKLIKQHQPPVVFAYESLPSVMKLNHVGSYQFSEKSEMPKPVKRIAQLVAGGREEDAFYGFVQIQKMTNRVMKFLPESFGGEKFKDVRTWMTASTYWTNSGEENIFNMLLYIAKQLWASPASPQPVQEFNTMGFFHPEHYEQTKEFFPDLKSYQKWEKKTKRDDKSRAKVGVLFSRKHLLCGQTYASDVVRALESKGLRVYACYVLGIELHIAARTWMKEIGVDALINLFGFPLVGGPAGSTKAGIANPAAQEILSDLNVPYIVAQPLFTQSKESWNEQGINPMQQMMMYSLPEMDGAIAPVVLGAIHQSKLQSETGRLDRLAGLVKQWTSLRQKKNSEKKLALVLYNYPPGTGHLGTAALLNVPASVFKLMRELKSAGYNVGDFFERTAGDEKKFLSLLQSSMSADSNPLTATVKEYTEWLLPAERQRIEARWGKAPGDVASLGSDRLIIGGLTFGNIYIGSQPNLYIVGDPMRLLFDKENTPHHQYAAFYRWLEHKFAADALVHVGMHGTAEWMPGQQIGMTDTCWSDILLGHFPQFYLYPMNNPSEANIAKRRGYAVILSHAIPPYARAGLYKEFTLLRDLIDDFRSGRDSTELRDAIAQKVGVLNLADDVKLTDDYAMYVSTLTTFLKEMEERLICGDLHTYGENAPPQTVATLIAESMKSEHGSALLMAACETLSFEPYAVLSAKAKKGDESAREAKAKVDLFCEQFVERCVVGTLPVGEFHI